MKFYKIVLFSLLIAATLLFAPTIRADDLARAYTDTGTVGLLLKIGGVLGVAAAGTIYTLYRRIVALEEQCMKLAETTQEILIDRLDINTQTLADIRARLGSR